MQMLRRIAVLSLALATATTANAQRAGTIEAGVFGHFTSLDKDVGLGSSSVGLGGRLGFFALRHLSLEAEYGFGTIESNTRDVSMWLPFRGMIVGHITVTPRVKFLLGAGYKADTWLGDTTANEFEDAFTGLGGLRICLNDGWSIRPEIVFDKNPSPNNQPSVTSTSSHLGFRVGVSKLFGRANNTCMNPQGPMAVPPPPPAARPPAAAAPPPVAAAPTANLSASPTSVVAGSSALLAWNSTNATRCTAPWTTSTATSGSQSVSPTATTTYTITCTGAGGTASAPVTVSVTQPAPPPPPPATPPAAAPPREIFRLEGVFFDFDQATIKPEGRTRLDSAVTILNRFAEMRVEIQGHTDSIGTNAYNDGLSMRRANAVREYLTSRGVPASRLTTRGFGEGSPIADNGSDAGRAQNRRVVLVEIRN